MQILNIVGILSLKPQIQLPWACLNRCYDDLILIQYNFEIQEKFIWNPCIFNVIIQTKP